MTEDPRSVSFPCLSVQQPIGLFYLASMPYTTLRDISYFDVRRRLQEERDVERYLGIQRPLNPSRVRSLEEYVNFYDATFPTSIIIAVDQRCALYDPERKIMTLSNIIGDDETDTVLFRHIARVLDGQHRIAGLFEYTGEKFELAVSLFVGIDIADQAQIFSTVNLEQTKVAKSLAYDLFALAQSRSPQKTCHNVAVALDQDADSPFYNRIKRLGVATEGRYAETITQATFVEALLPMISINPRQDRDKLLRGSNIQPASADDLDKTPFRNLFIAGRDIDIAEIVYNYFAAVRERWPTAWNYVGRGIMLNKTNGFRALMRILRPAYNYTKHNNDSIPSEGDFLRLFEQANLSDDDFTTERFVPGSAGEASLFHSLLVAMRLAEVR